MFVIEDPAKRKPPRSRYLQQSQVRSHLASNYHKRRQRQQPNTTNFGGQSFVFCVDEDVPIPDHPDHGESNNKSSSQSLQSSLHSKQIPDSENENKNQNTFLELWQKQRLAPCPGAVIDVGFIGEEGRTFQFFRERTALEWPGWCDAEFWNVLALQASHSHSSLKHALISLGAYHESLEIPDELNKDKQLAFSLQQSQQAIAGMLKDSQMSMSALLSTYIVIAANSACLQWTRFWQTQHTIFQIFDEVNARPSRISSTEMMFISKYLAPIIERQRGKAGQYVDILSCLKTTEPNHFYTSEPPSVPIKFTTLRQARDTLETLLRWTTYMTKILDLPALVIPKAAENFFHMWFQRLDQFNASEDLSLRDQFNIPVLRVSAKIGIMLIKTMNAEENNELIFDEFTSTYQEVSNVFRQVLDHNESVSSSHTRFGIDGGMLALVGNTANRWCRDPKIRRSIISSLHRAQRREAAEDGVVWARMVECTVYLEELGIYPPPQSAQDMPAEKRVKCLHVSFYQRANVQQMRYHLAPYTDSPANYKDICIPYIVGSSRQGVIPETMAIRPGEKPDVILGRGFTSWPKDDSQGFTTISHPKFYFPLPKI